MKDTCDGCAHEAGGCTQDDESTAEIGALFAATRRPTEYGALILANAAKAGEATVVLTICPDCRKRMDNKP